MHGISAHGMHVHVLRWVCSLGVGAVGVVNVWMYMRNLQRHISSVVVLHVDGVASMFICALLHGSNSTAGPSWFEKVENCCRPAQVVFPDCS